MPATPPSNEPSLPKLRRFRFDPDDPKVAREVDLDGNPKAAASTDPESAGSNLPASDSVDSNLSDSNSANSTLADSNLGESELRESDLQESDRLIAELNGRTASPSPTTSPTGGSAAKQRPAARPSSTDTRRAPTPRPTTDPATRGQVTDPATRRPASALTSGAPAADNRQSPATGPTTTPNPTTAQGRPSRDNAEPPPSGAGAPRTRKSWPYAIAGLAAVLVIGVIAWFVLTPGADDTDKSQNPAGGASEVGDWAAGVCTELTDFQSSTLPLRAEVAKATASGSDESESDESSDTVLSDLQRKAADLLATLATDLQSVGLPSGSKSASSAHTTILSAVNAAATSVKSSGESAVGTPQDAASSILSGLDRPATIFHDAIEALPEAERDAVAAESACSALL